jgi:hypothetical protein
MLQEPGAIAFSSATGVLSRPEVIITVSPAWAFLTSSESFVLASNIVAVVTGASRLLINLS